MNKSSFEQELTRAGKLPTGLPWRLLLLAFIIFGAVVFIYLGMIFGYEPYIDSQFKKVEQEISELNASIEKEQQKNLIEFYSQLVNIQELFNSHILTSNIFDFLEKNTYPSVYFTSIDFSISKKEGKINGLTSSYNILAQQLELFRLSPEVEKVILNDSRLLKGGTVNFAITLILKQETLSF